MSPNGNGEEAPPLWVVKPDLNVAGTISPNVKGRYYWHSQWYDYSVWYRPETGYYVWGNEVGQTWYLANTWTMEPGDSDSWWEHTGTTPKGKYYNRGQAGGWAWVVPMKGDPDVMTAWEFWGKYKEWLVRSGAHKRLAGQAMYPRTVWPPEYIYAYYQAYPRPFITAPVPVQQSAIWRPSAKLVQYSETFAAPVEPHPQSGISIFQVRPYKADHPNERRFTRIMGSQSPWPPTTALTHAVHCKVKFMPPPGVHVRYYARTWWDMDFRHVGPTWTTKPTTGHCHVAGGGPPSPAGDYPYSGTYGNQPVYSRSDQVWHIWYWVHVPWWVISHLPGTFTEYWYRADGMEGEYVPGYQVQGNPTVTYIPPEDP